MRRAHRSTHYRVWLVLAVLLPLGFLLGVALHQDRPVEPTRFDASGVASD